MFLGGVEAAVKVLSVEEEEDTDMLRRTIIKQRAVSLLLVQSQE